MSRLSGAPRTDQAPRFTGSKLLGAPRFAPSGAPNISSFSVSNPTGQDVQVTFGSDEQLGSSSGDIDVGISGVETASLARGDFSESGSGPYTYTATYAGSTDGDYTATLNAAKDIVGNDGASGQSDTATVDTTTTSISPFTFDANPTEPQDGEDVTFTVPGDGEGDAYTVEVIDVNTGQVFTTLSWTGSQYGGAVTFNGTDGDSFTFEAKKTRDSDGATKQSDNQETITIFVAGQGPDSVTLVSSSLDWQIGPFPESTSLSNNTVSWQ